MRTPLECSFAVAPWSAHPIDNAWRCVWAKLGLYDQDAGKGPGFFSWLEYKSIEKADPSGGAVSPPDSSTSDGKLAKAAAAQDVMSTSQRVEMSWGEREVPGIGRQACTRVDVKLSSNELEATGWHYWAPLPSGLRPIHFSCAAATFCIGPLLAAIMAYHVLTSTRYRVPRCPSCQEPLRALAAPVCPKCGTALFGAPPDAGIQGGTCQELVIEPSARSARGSGLRRTAYAVALAVCLFVGFASMLGGLTKPLLVVPWNIHYTSDCSWTEWVLRRVSAFVWHSCPGVESHDDRWPGLEVACFYEMPPILQQIHVACVGTIRTSWILLLSLLVYHRVAFRYFAPAPYPRCRKCGYALVGLSKPRCPECGEPV
jgi:hypothetical protein